MGEVGARHHEDVVTFITRQLLDTVAPSNFLATNPQVLARSAQAMGTNLWQGALNLWDDWERQQANLSQEVLADTVPRA